MDADWIGIAAPIAVMIFFIVLLRERVLRKRLPIESGLVPIAEDFHFRSAGRLSLYADFLVCKDSLSHEMHIVPYARISRLGTNEIKYIDPSITACIEYVDEQEKARFAQFQSLNGKSVLQVLRQKLSETRAAVVEASTK